MADTLSGEECTIDGIDRAVRVRIIFIFRKSYLRRRIQPTITQSIFDDSGRPFTCPIRSVISIIEVCNEMS